MPTTPQPFSDLPGTNANAAIQPVLHASPTEHSKIAPVVKPSSRVRLDSIDLLRGLVIVVMALDHVKGNILHAPFDLVDLNRTDAVHFLTRWITHFCAPVFIFLAGTAAFLYGAQPRTKGQVAWFLLSRGIWLVFLELTVIRFVWLLNVNYAYAFGGVLWAIGWSMIALAGLVFLPISAIAAFGLAMICFHNLSDGVRADSWGEYRWVWCILHTGEMFHVVADVQFHPFYPLIPWIGVMAVGYAFGPMLFLERQRRRQEVLGLGIMLCLIFAVLRYGNIYGDKAATEMGRPGPWVPWDGWLFTIFSFINCQKYPPSLDFLLMTLGPALILLSLLDREREFGWFGRFFVIFGRVPLFFYLLHWFVIKGVALGLQPADSGSSLWVVYVVWVGVVLFFFPLCQWFADVKRRSRAAWLRYL